MKLLVFSDSHGYLDYMRSAIKGEKPQFVIHLGDHSQDAEKLRDEFLTLPILSVRGNCDYFDLNTADISLPVYDGVRIMAVHGHQYGVKNGFLRLALAAKEKSVQIALFGHAHCAYCEQHDGMWLLNPGTCGIRSHGMYGLIEITDGQAICSVKTVQEGMSFYDTCY